MEKKTLILIGAGVIAIGGIGYCIYRLIGGTDAQMAAMEVDPQLEALNESFKEHKIAAAKIPLTEEQKDEIRSSPDAKIELSTEQKDQLRAVKSKKMAGGSGMDGMQQIGL